MKSIKPQKKLIILDRDGVINEDSDDYVKSPEEWLPIPGSLEAIASLNQAGYTVAVATNQSGIARRLYNEQTLQAIHHKMQTALAAVGGAIDQIFYCPHSPLDQCLCRKPKPGLFQKIQKHYGLSLWNVPAVGDSLRDCQAAKQMGCRVMLVQTGNGSHTLTTQATPLEIIKPQVFADLQAVAQCLLEETT